MMRFFGERIDSIHVDSFRDAMSAIEEGSAEFAVLPIENSTAGIVSEIYDLLVERRIQQAIDLRAFGEVFFA